jgi:hypothetical protein
MMKYLTLVLMLVACGDFSSPNSTFPGVEPDWHIVNYYQPTALDHCVVMEAADNSLIRLCGVDPVYVSPTKTLEVPPGTTCIAIFAQDQQPKRNPTILDGEDCQ